MLMRFGRVLNTNTMMWEYPKKGTTIVSVPDELMPKEPINVFVWIAIRERLEKESKH